MTTLVAFIFGWIFIFLAGNKTTIKSSMSLNFSKIPLLTFELAALEGQLLLRV